jgi:two-component system KDP operon response regulator KdpE
MSVSKPRILVVDDEPKMVRLLREALTATGFDVLAASNGENAIATIALEQPDLIILDIMLTGGMDGFEVCRRLREFSDAPVLMLTAKVRDADRLRGFECGTDDYITKPFNTKELIARVRAVLKRTQGGKQSAPEVVLDYGELHIDMAQRRVFVRGKEIHLTPTEYELLSEFARHPNQVLLHEQLLTAVWGEMYRQDAEYLRAYIYTLRKKIEIDPVHPKLILRSPGVGYMLVVGE